jgi:hypothetical protein
MNAPPFPANPSFGQYYGNWVWSGSRWVCTNTSGVRVVVQKFFASAPYTPSPGLISCVVECLGGGGAGGWASVAGVYVMGGGGGGSGSYSRIALPAALVLGGVNVIVGQGALGPSPYTEATATSFGAFCIANPGQRGKPMNGQPNALAEGENGESGKGGAPGIGDLALPGSDGWPGNFEVFAPDQFIWIDTARGGEMFGGSHTFAIEPTMGAQGPNADPNSGAGGGGGIVNQATAVNNFDGGNGGNGWCIVTEYCWADALDDGCGCGTTTSGARVAISASPQGYGWDGND